MDILTNKIFFSQLFSDYQIKWKEINELIKNFAKESG